MTKTTTWIGKVAVVAVCLAVAAALVLAAVSDPADAKKKKRPRGGGIAGFALNSDLLDGKDSTAFFSGEIYRNDGNAVQGSPTQINTAGAECDAGDTPLSGGHRVNSGNPSFVFFEATDKFSHQVQFTSSLNVTANVTCADFPPLRSENAAQSEPKGENSEQSDPDQENSEPGDPKGESTGPSNTGR